MSGQPSKRHPLYGAWIGMRQRCNNPRSESYKWYGARGIRVCERWSDFGSFLEDMGPRPPGASLDRINPRGNYEPGNCRWASPAEQGENRKYERVTLDGEEMSIAEAAARFGLTRDAVYQRMSRGWDLMRALTRPAQKRRTNRPVTTEPTR